MIEDVISALDRVTAADKAWGTAEQERWEATLRAEAAQGVRINAHKQACEALITNLGAGEAVIHRSCVWWVSRETGLQRLPVHQAEAPTEQVATIRALLDQAEQMGLPTDQDDDNAQDDEDASREEADDRRRGN